MTTPRKGLDIEQIASPGSFIDLDMEDQEVQADKKQFATVKGEFKISKGGQKYVVFREGQHYLNRMTEQSVEMLKHAMLEEHNTTSHGVDSKKVLQFITSTVEFLEHGNPTVKDMRSGNPRAVQLLFHMDEMMKGSTKIKKTWAPENKPEGWPQDVPFEDPNNGSQTKKERAGKDGQKNDKLKKIGLGKMYVYLRGEFLSKRGEILQKKAEYLGNLPTSLRSNNTSSPCGERLIVLHHRTNGVLQEAVSNTSIATDLSSLLDMMFTLTGEGQRMRIVFAEVCCAIQTCIDIALLKDKLDRPAIINNLHQIYVAPFLYGFSDRYKGVTTDNSVQQVSTDTPECYTGLNSFQVQQQEVLVLPSPGGNNWNHLTAQQQPMAYKQEVQQFHQQPQQQQPQQQHPQQQQPQQQQPQQQQFHPQPMSLKPEDKLQQQIKLLKLSTSDCQMDSQPSTTMEMMHNTSAYRQTHPMFGSDVDYMKNVLPNDSAILGKRKLDEDDNEILSSPGKTFTSLMSHAPATDFTTPVQISDYHLQSLLDVLAANHGSQVSLDNATPAESHQVNQLFAQESIEGNASTAVNYWSPPPEGMDIDQ